jgi:hypothetical protein
VSRHLTKTKKQGAVANATAPFLSLLFRAFLLSRALSKTLRLSKGAKPVLSGIEGSKGVFVVMLLQFLITPLLFRPSCRVPVCELGIARSRSAAWSEAFACNVLAKRLPP